VVVSSTAADQTQRNFFFRILPISTFKWGMPKRCGFLLPLLLLGTNTV